VLKGLIAVIVDRYVLPGIVAGDVDLSCYATKLDIVRNVVVEIQLVRSAQGNFNEAVPPMP